MVLRMRDSSTGTLLRAGFARSTLENGLPGGAAVVGRLRFEDLSARVGKFIGSPDLDRLAVVFEAAGVGPDIAFGLGLAGVGLASRVGYGHVVIDVVFAVVRVGGELVVIASRQFDQLIANQEDPLRRPAALQGRADLVVGSSE